MRRYTYRPLAAVALLVTASFADAGRAADRRSRVSVVDAQQAVLPGVRYCRDEPENGTFRGNGVRV